MSEAGSVMEYNCDLCGCADAVEVPHAREYTNNQPIHICTSCGFVYVRRRRSSQDIADTWSQELYGEHYQPRLPAIKARQTYVAEWLDIQFPLKGKSLVDIGAGEGQFLQLVQNQYGAIGFGIEPSTANCRLVRQKGLSVFHGTVEQYAESADFREGFADVVTVMWTLENCRSCRTLVEIAHRILKPEGVLVLATGSRLLVPFKKPLNLYLDPNYPADIHSFRWSANTLKGVACEGHFRPVSINRYLDSDVLCVLARKAPVTEKIEWRGDNYREVEDFFERWHRESQYYANVVEAPEGSHEVNEREDFSGVPRGNGANH